MGGIIRSQSDKMLKAVFIMIMTAALVWVVAASGMEYGKERPIAILVGSEQEQPATDGHIVAWSDNRSGNYDIFMYDLETGLENGCVSIPSSRSIQQSQASA